MSCLYFVKGIVDSCTDILDGPACKRFEEAKLCTGLLSSLCRKTCKKCGTYNLLLNAKFSKNFVSI